MYIQSLFALQMQANSHHQQHSSLKAHVHTYEIFTKSILMIWVDRFAVFPITHDVSFNGSRVGNEGYLI